MFTGSMVALITPFKGGKIDWPSLERLIDFHIQSGTHGVVPCGTTGESATLSHEEHEEVINAVIKSVNRRLPVIAGTGSNSTDEAVRLTRAAEKSGADGALMISPYYNRPTQEGIYQHYKKVASEVAIPIIVYNIPGRTGSKIEPETLARLAEIKNIAGVKEATGSVDQAEFDHRLFELLDIAFGHPGERQAQLASAFIHQRSSGLDGNRVGLNEKAADQWSQLQLQIAPSLPLSAEASLRKL